MDDRGPITVTFDNTPPDGEPGVLVGFAGGADARRWQRMTHSARRNEALECFARLFGKSARGALHYIEQDWASEEWSRGGPVALMGPGAVGDVRPGAARAGGPGALGGHRDRGHMVRLHGRRGPLGRARRGRGALAAAYCRQSFSPKS